MKPEWKAILDDAGAEYAEDGGVTGFGNEVRELRVVTTGDVLCDLSHYGLISVRGEDAREFLQNQFTNDLRLVDDQASQLSAYCSPKGRIMALFRIIHHADSFYLMLPRELLEPVMKRLQMFVLRSKVVLEDASDAWIRFGYSGPNAERELADILGGIPAEPDQAVVSGQSGVIRLPGTMPRFLVFSAFDEARDLWTRLSVRAAPVGAPAWRLLDILAGVPEVTAETVEAFVPQMLNLQLINGVSFRKGCYPGQEVVARMQYLGKLKRRMYLAHVDADTPPEPGTALFSDQVDSGQGAGKLVSAAPDPDGGYMVLAVAVIEAAEHGTLRLGAPDGPALETRTLPYAFPAAEDENKPA